MARITDRFQSNWKFDLPRTELANLFKIFLKKLGFNSVSFTDPIIALEDSSQNSDKYSLVITDLRMLILMEYNLLKESEIEIQGLKLF